jgi:hypothetical protein
VPSDWPPSTLLSFVPLERCRRRRCCCCCCCCYCPLLLLSAPCLHSRAVARTIPALCLLWLLWLLWDRGVTGRANWRPRGCAGCWVLGAGRWLLGWVVPCTAYCLLPTAYCRLPPVHARPAANGEGDRRRRLGKAHATILPCCHLPPISHPPILPTTSNCRVSNQPPLLLRAALMKHCRSVGR